MIADRLNHVIQRIQKVDHSQKVKLIAVSKKKSIALIKEAINSGQKDFGENYLQEAVEKIKAIDEPSLTWHFIGPIQSNKTASIAKYFQWVHSVDRKKVLTRLNEQSKENQKVLNVLIQVNIDDEDTKFGVIPNEIDDLVNYANELSNISLKGFMCIPKPGNSNESFKKMKILLNSYPCLESLSMGMSNDLEVAIRNGSTMVRIGTDIFGAR
ncbi:YggS family pyridoxal phosphate-dependent enzyme [Gammaproteobacteria bacterium]|nr:YggS family pyridoxal phosphate-dependent enzyme [Gammaproteobacteria bacterium]